MGTVVWLTGSEVCAPCIGVLQGQSPLPCVSGGRRAAVRAHVEGQLRPHPDSPCGWSSAHRAGTEAGGPAPHALWPLLLERLQEAQRTSLWTADIVSVALSDLFVPFVHTGSHKTGQCQTKCRLEWSAARLRSNNKTKKVTEIWTQRQKLLTKTKRETDGLSLKSNLQDKPKAL